MIHATRHRFGKLLSFVVDLVLYATLEAQGSKLHFQSDNSLRSAVQYSKSQHGRISKEAFGRIEKSLGLNYAPAGQGHYSLTLFGTFWMVAL